MRTILSIVATVTMHKTGVLTTLVALVAFNSVALASIDTFTMADDGDGVITCEATWDATPGIMTIVGDHLLWDAGHVLAEEGDLTTDTEEDPTVIIANIIDNDTNFAWTKYTIKVAIRAVVPDAEDPDTDLTSLSLTVDEFADAPDNWLASVTQELTYTESYTDADGTVREDYFVGQIEYTAGTPVPVTGYVDLRYTLSFEGATSYLLSQEMTPIPEPTTLTLLALGGLAVLRRRRKQ